ncbi:MULTISPECIES: DUF2589 domain-containing protein [unclassified Bradyrhizobium]|uniref:DUF2589 domain-containing protein n=1 Tax=unclassified Bradyrhizobium TaxID=2631580 RepID=UPI0028E2E7AC|nr:MULTISPECIES: DUF2589 domain-containing protein [unclassified Bradyrhizobium]
MMPAEIGPVVNLQDIFAAPILAVIKANVAAAREFVAFIEAVGFVRSASDPSQMLGELRMVTFSYEDAGARQPAAKRLFSVPVLSLIPLPLLEVKDASFDFGVRLIAAYDPLLDRSPPSLPVPGNEDDPLDVSWRAMLATGWPPARGEEVRPDLAPHLDANVGVRLNVGQADVPAGIQNMIALLGENARLSAALLTVQPRQCTLAPTHPVAEFTLNVVTDRRPGAELLAIELLYAPDGGIEIRAADGELWPMGEERRPDELGVLQARVHLTGSPIPPPRRIPLLFRTEVDGAVVIVELDCILNLEIGAAK